jgi:hypothetical protein
MAKEVSVPRRTSTRATSASDQTAFATYVEHGTLASRLVRALGPAPTVETVTTVYRRLAKGLDANRGFKL